MRSLLVSLLMCGLLPALSAPPAVARSLPAHAHARHKTGPVTIRGIARHVHPHDFTLQTTRHGQYAVLMTSATGVADKGRHGSLTLKEGDHVGVRGFLDSGRIRAILVRIYPVKPKPYTIRGTVQTTRGSDLVVTDRGKSVHVQITS